MSSGRAGFGEARIDPRAQNQNISDQELLAAAGDHTALLQRIEQHLNNLDKRYVESPVLQPVQINIQGSATAFSQRIDYSNVPHNSVIVNVTAGTLNVWWGDYSGIGQSANPHFQVAGGQTTQLFLPLLGRVYTVVNPSTTIAVVACLTPAAI